MSQLVNAEESSGNSKAVLTSNYTQAAQAQAVSDYHPA